MDEGTGGKTMTKTSMTTVASNYEDEGDNDENDDVDDRESERHEVDG